METTGLKESLETSVTEATLKACLECAVQEFPANKHLAIAIGSVINRFFRSQDNNKFVAQTIKAIPEPEQSEIVNSPGFSVWTPNRDAFSKKALPLTSGPEKGVVAGKGIDEVMERLGQKVGDKLKAQEATVAAEAETKNLADASTIQEHEGNVAADNASGTDAAADNVLSQTTNAENVLNEGQQAKVEAIADPNRSPLLDLTVKEFETMYGGLKGLKAFAKETLEIEPPRTANAEQMVKLIKAKLEKDAQS